MRGIVRRLTPYPMQGQYGASSSALQGFGHSNLNQLLDIEFAAGGVYRYTGVSKEVFRDLNSASSQGTYFNTNIRNRYAYRQLE